MGVKQEIEVFIEQFNQSWTKGQSDNLVPLIHDEAVFLAPDLITELRGRDNCIQTIKDYSDNANTKSFDVTDKNIHIWQQTAIVALEYRVEYEINDQNYKEKGREFWTLSKQGETWKLVWRAMVQNEKIE